MLEVLRRWIWLFYDYRVNDPVYNCSVYKEEGCSHVDGFLCDIKTCSSIKEYSFF